MKFYAFTHLSVKNALVISTFFFENEILIYFRTLGKAGRFWFCSVS